MESFKHVINYSAVWIGLYSLWSYPLTFSHFPANFLSLTLSLSLKNRSFHVNHQWLSPNPSPPLIPPNSYLIVFSPIFSIAFSRYSAFTDHESVFIKTNSFWVLSELNVSVDFAFDPLFSSLYPNVWALTLKY